ncbi:MAG: DNA gyrase subunit A [Gammaproteobacteria bacterium]
MTDFAKELSSVALEEELKRSYLDYAMSVIVGRALPDVRDGLKPVHRRVLHAMRELGNEWNKPYKKSARVVGDVIGKYHPHGDVAVYDAIVRMAQPFALRYVLVDGQGNFGSVDGDAPAAMRYTEIRMAKIAHALLEDIDKETVDFIPNYDGSESEPQVLPARVPNLLINGSAGIAVGMATNIPPHNLRETIDAALALLDHPTMELPEILKLLPGPDFPTGGIILGDEGIRKAYETGRGGLTVRGRARTEPIANGRESIVIYELPYQVNKATLIEYIAAQVRERKIEGISELRDESDRDGMRIVIELRRGENADVILNNLYQRTALQSSFVINMVALKDGQPRLFDLRSMLLSFLEHRREVVTRRTIFELKKARERAHVLEGLALAISNIDEMIQVIKKAGQPSEARAALIARSWPGDFLRELLERAGDRAASERRREVYQLTENQAQAILELRLQRLTGLEREKIVDEYLDLLHRIDDYEDILSRDVRLIEEIRLELVAARDEFGDARRTELAPAGGILRTEDLIPQEDVVVTLSHDGYIKYQSLDTYRLQARGGRGRSAAAVKEEDFVEKLFLTRTHDTLLCFSTRGRVYWTRVFELPEGGGTAKGKPLVNLLPLEDSERITAVLDIDRFDDSHFVFMATAKGTVKKVPLKDFSRPRASGIIAIDLPEDDTLIDAVRTDGSRHLMLFASNGKAIRFIETEVRTMGRQATGVRGIRLTPDSRVVAVTVLEDESSDILTVTERGYGKRTALAAYLAQARGGKGVISIQTGPRNGLVIGAASVHEGDEAMLVTQNGTLVRIPVGTISRVGRNTQGVRLIRLDEGDIVVHLERIPVDPAPVLTSEEGI